jgi:methyl-accepting chemotaxis protein
MKIKTKLALNLTTVIVMIAAVSITSILGMWFIKGKLFYLTERSTPFQMKTLDFQRAVQGVTADLVKVGFATSITDYKTSRSEAEKSLAEVKALETALKELMGGGDLETYKELSDTGSQLFGITEGRLQSVNDAETVGLELSNKMTAAVKQLKELDNKVKSMQTSKNATFSTSFEKTKDITGAVRKIENLNASLKDLQLAMGEMLRATGRKQVTIAKGKAATALSKIQQNDYLKTSKAISLDDIRKLTDKLDEVQKAQIAMFEKPGEENKNLFDTAARDLNERLSGVILATEQESGLVSEAYNYEVGKQGTAYSQSNSATAILTLNAELLAQGLTIEGHTSRLFSLDTINDLESTRAEMRNSFGRIDPIEKSLSKQLLAAGAKNEEKTLRSVMGSMRSIQSAILADNGIIAKLTHSLEMKLKSEAAIQKLREIVIKQAQKGRETITTASGEQAKAIGSVNKLVRFSIIAIAAIGLFAIVLGIAFGTWVYRSISRPLGELVRITDQVSGGDLRCTVDTASTDEIGIVQASVGKMVDNLHRIVASISDSTHRLAGSSQQLSGTAVSLEQGAKEQTAQVEQSAAAITEMSQTNMDVARNSAETAEAAAVMKQTAENGRATMSETMTELNKFAGAVQESAARIESLGQRSDEINNMVELIKDVADQTNLLALNAAIEAARAGDQGRGFAVVADSVRQLAQRTTEATNEIAQTVRAMQSDVQASVELMQDERESVQQLVEKVSKSLGEIDQITENVEKVSGMVAQIAVATEEQSFVSADVSHNMEGIAGLTRQLSESLNEIKRESGDLSQLAEELNRMAEWFKV